MNVGGTGKLPMSDLRALCGAAGLKAVRTYIASGNVVCDSDGDAGSVRTALEARLEAYAGKPVGVLVRSAAEMAAIVQANPFPEAPGNRVMAIFLDTPATQAMIDAVTFRAEDEALRLGAREIYVHYGSGMGASKLRIPAAKHGTARNMNTVATLARMAAG